MDQQMARKHGLFEPIHPSTWHATPWTNEYEATPLLSETPVLTLSPSCLKVSTGAVRRFIFARVRDLNSVHSRVPLLYPGRRGTLQDSPQDFR